MNMHWQDRHTHHLTVFRVQLFGSAAKSIDRLKHIIAGEAKAAEETVTKSTMTLTLSHQVVQLNEFHFLQHVNSCVSPHSTLFFVFMFLPFPCTHSRELNRTLFWLPPFLFLNETQALQENAKPCLLAGWLPCFLLLLCYHAHSLYRSLFLQPSLSCGILSLSLTLCLSHISCLLSASV